MIYSDVNTATGVQQIEVVKHVENKRKEDFKRLLLECPVLSWSASRMIRATWRGIQGLHRNLKLRKTANKNITFTKFINEKEEVWRPQLHVFSGFLSYMYILCNLKAEVQKIPQLVIKKNFSNSCDVQINYTVSSLNSYFRLLLN